MLQKKHERELSRHFRVISLSLASFLSLFSVLLVFSPEPVLALDPNFSFSPSSATIEVGRLYSAEVMLDSVGQSVAGAGAKITFDPQIISVASIQPGTIFGDYPMASFDNNSGEIFISGIASSSRNLFAGRGVFATISFKGIALGTTTVQFVFVPGSTTDSNIAVTYGSGDILGKVYNLEVNVVASGVQTVGEPTQGSIPTQVVATQATATPTPAPSESFFSWLLERLGLKQKTAEPQVSSELRPTSQPLDPHAPLTLQEPIRDPGQAQPEAMVPTLSKRSSWSTLAAIILACILVSGVVAGVYWWRKKRG